ncbi:MAG: phosphoribosyltransferase [Bdellovibrionales bacterium]|nr:phosphoribosyltransferase [Bdellovibrionales bacterium]
MDGQRCPDGMWRVEDQALPFVLRGLYRWDESDASSAARLRSVILSSKGGPSGELTRTWTSSFVATALRERCRFTHVVNPPGRSGLWELDHSGAVAAEIAAVLELEHFKEVYRPKGSGQRQKEKGRDERLSTGHLSILSEVPRGASWLFVDDVVATGGTACRVWKALGKPRRFEAWAIAWRTRQR